MNTKEFIKNHKKELIIAGSITAGAVILFIARRSYASGVHKGMDMAFKIAYAREHNYFKAAFETGYLTADDSKEEAFLAVCQALNVGVKRMGD